MKKDKFVHEYLYIDVSKRLLIKIYSDIKKVFQVYAIDCN